MPLSWNEIKHRAIAFSKEWKDETREDAEAKSFWDAFFHVFGLQRRQLASFEEPVKKLSGDWAYIDLFWAGTLLAEHKSAGKDLGKAHAQGMEYIRALVDSGRGKEVPRYLIVSDFQRIAIHDLEPEQDPDAPLFHRLPPSFEFPLADFHKHIRHFFFIAGYKQHKLNPEDPANEEATLLMCDLHDALEEGEYGTDATGHAGHELKQFLVRLLFCLFAEDNGIFPTRAFQLYLEDHTAADGSDLGPKLGQLFDVLAGPDPIPPGTIAGTDGVLGTADDVPNPNVDAPGGKYLGCNAGVWNFAAGRAGGSDAIGGLSTNYASPLRTDKAHQMIGYAKSSENGKGCIFTATQIKGVGNAPIFKGDAAGSGVPMLAPSADPGAIKLFILDCGAGSLALMHIDPSGTIQPAYLLTSPWHRLHSRP